MRRAICFELCRQSPQRDRVLSLPPGLTSVLSTTTTSTVAWKLPAAVMTQAPSYPIQPDRRRASAGRAANLPSLSRPGRGSRSGTLASAAAKRPADLRSPSSAESGRRRSRLGQLSSNVSPPRARSLPGSSFRLSSVVKTGVVARGRDDRFRSTPTCRPGPPVNPRSRSYANAWAWALAP
jgi:hypothetical protein